MAGKRDAGAPGAIAVSAAPVVRLTHGRRSNSARRQDAVVTADQNHGGTPDLAQEPAGCARPRHGRAPEQPLSGSPNGRTGKSAQAVPPAPPRTARPAIGRRAPLPQAAVIALYASPLGRPGPARHERAPAAAPGHRWHVRRHGPDRVTHREEPRYGCHQTYRLPRADPATTGSDVDVALFAPVARHRPERVVLAGDEEYVHQVAMSPRASRASGGLNCWRQLGEAGHLSVAERPRNRSTGGRPT